MLKRFSDLKIMTKLIVLFIIFAAFIGGVGYIGIHNMEKINSNAIKMHDYNLKSVEQLNAIKENYSTIRADLLKLAYKETMDINEINGITKEVNELFKQNDKFLDDYKNKLLNFRR